MVEAVGELDARTFSGASGSLDAGDYSRPFFMGGADAHGGGRGSRDSRNRGFSASLSAALTEHFAAGGSFIFF
jgi:hypothetical protein